MRLFDKCLTQTAPEDRKMLADIAHRAVVVAVDPIAEHYGMNEKMLWGPEDYPYCLPPWDLSFVEWNEPRTIKTPDGLIKTTPGNQQGAVVVRYPGGRPTAEKWWGRLMQMTGGIVNGADKGSVSLQSDAEHCISVAFYGHSCGMTVGYRVMTFAFLTADGTVTNKLTTGSGMQHMLDLIGVEETQRFYDSACHVVFLAFTFANCANVKLEDVTDDLQPEPKIRRRLKIPEVKRYTLNICGHSSKPSRDYNQGPQGVMPFHLCRGHFATYTAERPMFGNPKLVGRFWHPPHMKGKKENGEVIKDYAIAAEA